MLRVIALFALFGCAISITYKKDDFLSGLTAFPADLSAKIEQGNKYGQPTQVERELQGFFDKVQALKRQYNMNTPEQIAAADDNTTLALALECIKEYKALSPEAKAYYMKYYPHLE